MPIYGYNAPITPAIFGTNMPSPYTPPAPASVVTAPGAPAPSGNPNSLIATQQNVSTIPDLATLTKAIDALNLAAQQQANAARIPNEPALEGQSSALIGSELAGQVPPDVINLLKQQGAETNVSTGRDSNAAYLRALGLTSLGQEQAGQANLSQATARNPVAPLFDPSKQLITPYEQARIALEQAALAQDFLRRTGGGTGGGGGSYAGTGGTAMGTPTRTYTSPGLTGLPPDTGTVQQPPPNAAPEDFAAWFENAFGVPYTDPNLPPSPTQESVSPSLTFDQLFPGLGTDQNLPPDWQPGMQLPDLVDASLYGG